jgi:hypothetical protein
MVAVFAFTPFDKLLSGTIERLHLQVQFRRASVED